MSRREHHTDYDKETTARCERALVTLLGDLGPCIETVWGVGYRFRPEPRPQT